MYERYYGFREKPFTLLPDPSFLYFSKQHRHALTMLEYVLAQGTGFALITGEIGSGKTTLIRYLLSRADAATRFGFITNTHRGMTSLLPWIASALGIASNGRSDADLYDAFVSHLVDEYAAGRRVVLIVDEAQSLSENLLEELRVLSNINRDKDLLLQTILVGQPELRGLMRSPGMIQFAQRIAIDYHLGKLPHSDTEAYIRHRLTVAGGPADTFTPEAIEILHKASGGVPRVLNVLCDTALIYGFGEHKATIDAELVEQVLRDRSGADRLLGSRPAQPKLTRGYSGTKGGKA